MTTTNAEQMSFETLVAVERARIVGLCTHLTGDFYAAEDLAQESLLIAWRQRHKLTDPSGFAYWLTAIARNVCHHHVRAKQYDRAHLPLAWENSQTVPVA